MLHNKCEVKAVLGLAQDRETQPAACLINGMINSVVIFVWFLFARLH